MKILLYDRFQLEEKASRHLKAWKAWHIILFVCAAVFGLTNYVFLQKTMELVGDNCILDPRKLEFTFVPFSNEIQDVQDFDNTETDDAESNDLNTTSTTVPDVTDKVKRETSDNTTVFNDTAGVDTDGSEYGNLTHHLVLDISRTLFQLESSSECQFAEYMPLLSTVFASVWITMFTMCPGGGHTRSGLSQPWRILAPALLFTLVMVGLTGHSFAVTNGGLLSFCRAFSNVTNSTTCSSVEPFLQSGWNSTWGIGGRVRATRAACAGVWASWACAAALLLARCIAAPDFVVKKTDVYLAKDPAQKVTPQLLATLKYSYRPNGSPSKRNDNVSLRSEPTATTELVTASVEHEQDSAPASLMDTPVNTPRNTENIELTHSPQELTNYRNVD